MGIPAIAPYDLPLESDLPDCRVSWKADSASAALLIHDMQTHFLRPFDQDADPLPGVIRNIQSIRQRCDELGIPVFYTAQPADQDPRDRGLQADFWGPGMSGSGQAIVDSLVPRDEHIVLTKWRYSAFQRTTLEEMLRARGRTQLLVTGVYAHIGCLLTSADAFMRDVQPFLIADAVGDFSRSTHDQALAYAAGRFARVLTTHQVMDSL